MGEIRTLVIPLITLHMIFLLDMKYPYKNEETYLKCSGKARGGSTQVVNGYLMPNGQACAERKCQTTKLRGGHLLFRNIGRG